MTLQDITIYKQTFTDVNESINHFEKNNRNIIFEKANDESYENAFQRGETLYSQLCEIIDDLTNVIKYKNDMMEFMKRCEENMKSLNERMNEMTTKLIRYKKEIVPKEQYLDYRSNMNAKRKETDNEKNRRICEELLEDIKEHVEEISKQRKEFTMERNQLKEELDNMKKEKEDMKNEIEKMIKERSGMSIEKEFIELAKDYVKKSDIPVSLKIEEEERKRKLKVEEERKSKSCQEILQSWTSKCTQLEEWTQKKFGDILFDSEIDNWEKGRCVFDKKLLKKQYVSIIIEDTTGNIFGCYVHSLIDKVYQKPDFKTIEDCHSFVFNLESIGRHKTPVIFRIKRDKSAHAFTLYGDDNDRLFVCGFDIVIFKEQKKSSSYCYQNVQSYFDYKKVERALIKNPDGGYGSERFTPKRIVAIQMK